MNQTTRNNLLAAHAHRMRQCATDTERILWRSPRALQLGVRFRRQEVLLGRFIVDFFAPSVRLIVEVDGPCHAKRRAADARRDRALDRAGYRVLRVEAEQVRRELPVVVELIRSGLKNE